MAHFVRDEKPASNRDTRRAHDQCAIGGKSDPACAGAHPKSTMRVCGLPGVRRSQAAYRKKVVIC
jgi:hypothetical protein